MHGSMTDRVAIVTGGATSVGYRLVEALADRGTHVVIGDTDRPAGEDAAEAVSERAPGTVRFVETDVTRPDDCRDLVDRTVRQFDQLDVLVNNAGYRDVIPFEDVSDEDWTRHLAVNLDGAFYCCRAAVPHLRESRAGRIVNLSSGVARLGHPQGAAPYVAAKAGVIGLTRALAIELGGDDITVNAIAPSIIRDSGMQAGTDPAHLDRKARENPVGRLPRTDDVVFVMMWLLAEHSAMINGQTIDLNGGRWMR